MDAQTFCMELKTGIVLLLFAFFFLGCVQFNDPVPTPLPPTAPASSPVASSIPMSSPPAVSSSPTVESSDFSGSWLYVLTGYDVFTGPDDPGLVKRIVDTPADGLVVDAQKYARVWFTSREVAAFKQNHATVLGYVSIGEAEDYRDYWNPDWTQTPPAWMGRVNPQWEGNVKVKYWDPAWQTIVMNYVGRIARQGFDGAYLDIVDAYEYWSDEDNGEEAFSDASFSGRRNYLDRDEAAARMIAFLALIRQEGRTVNPDFKVFPQNAQQLVEYPGYLDAIDGIGREDTWYVDYDDRNAPGSVAVPSDASRLDYELEPLRKIKAAGKTVLVVDYFAPNQSGLARDFRTRAEAEGFHLYPADTRKLDDVSSLFSAR